MTTTSGTTGTARRARHGDRAMAFIVRACGPDDRPTDDRPGTARSLEHARELAYSALARTDRPIGSVQITGLLYEFRGSWVPLHGRDVPYHREVVRREETDDDRAGRPAAG